MNHPPRTAAVAAKNKSFHADIVQKVEQAIAGHDIVVVGMAWNPHCKRACGKLEAAGQAVEYMEFGSYASSWQERLALKIWTQWPTFPQVFVKGVFIGGADEAEAALADGSFQELLDAVRPS